MIKSLDEDEMAIFLSVDSKLLFVNEWKEGIQTVSKILKQETEVSKEDFKDLKNFLKNNIEFLQHDSEFDKNEDFDKVKELFNLNEKE
jgi:hypothetical protein